WYKQRLMVVCGIRARLYGGSGRLIQESRHLIRESEGRESQQYLDSEEAVWAPVKQDESASAEYPSFIVLIDELLNWEDSHSSAEPGVGLRAPDEILVTRGGSLLFHGPPEAQQWEIVPNWGCKTELGSL
ncbi:hypothetical protein FOZ60_014178, partial [Perkinsus olseni]